MKTFQPAALLVSLVALSACATATVEPAAPAGQAVAAQQAAPEEEQITGSRIPSNRTEKMVGQIGGKDYKETKAAQTNPGPRF